KARGSDRVRHEHRSQKLCRPPRGRRGIGGGAELKRALPLALSVGAARNRRAALHCFAIEKLVRKFPLEAHLWASPAVVLAQLHGLRSAQPLGNYAQGRAACRCFVNSSQSKRSETVFS